MSDLASFASMPAAPAAADNQTVILWVVGVLMAALGVSLVLLKRKLDQQESECREQNKEARAEAQAAREQIERLYQEAVKATAERETRLVEVVERNTAAFNALKDTVGSGYYRAIREERLKGERGAG